MRTFEFEGVRYNPIAIRYVSKITVSYANKTAIYANNKEQPIDECWFFIVFSHNENDYIKIDNKDIDKLKEKRDEFIYSWNRALTAHEC